jgi:hypothetical protein
MSVSICFSALTSALRRTYNKGAVSLRIQLYQDKMTKKAARNLTIAANS